jgi:hypothetical protein
LCDAFGIQGVEYFGREKRGQRTASGAEDGFWKTEAMQQVTQRGCAQTRRQRELQPGGERLAA